MAHISLLTLLKCCVLLGLSQGCTIPSSLRGSWLSSEKNELEFSTTSFSGYQVSTFSTSNFTCIETSGNYTLFKSNAFSRFGLQFHAYLCLSFSEISSNLFTYYKHSEKQADASYERVLVKLSVLSQATVSEACTVTDVTNVSYSVLMANGSIESVKTTCPIPFLGDFSYTYDTGSGNLCPNGSDLKVCDDLKDTMTFNYTYCSQIQAYSAGGVVSCIYSSSQSNVYTLHVYNHDATTDQSTTYRFTCYRVFGYETPYATQYPGDCPATMNYTYVASPGAMLTLNASVVCAYSSEDSTSTLSAGIIAAIAILCFLLFFALIFAILYYFYTKRKKRKQAEWEAANKKVDPEELSPNMRLGLPDESKYDLDRLMYSPDMKNGLIKRSPRKDMVGLEGLEGYKDGETYINENERQNVLESQLFAEKRKRKDAKDEFNAAKRTNKIYSARITELAKGKKRPLRAAALAKLKLKPKARPMANSSDTDGRATKAKDILIQVEEADGEGKRKTRFADEEGVTKTPKPDEKKAKKLEDVETLSDIVDNENAVDDLSDDDTKEKRLILPNLRQEKTPKKKRPKDRFSLGKAPQTPNMPHNTRFMAPKSKRKDDEPDFAEPMPLQRSNPSFDFSPLARIHRKDNPKAWKDAFGDKNGMESMDLETLKRQLPENRWKKLLEELYKDKKYFDYVKDSSSAADAELFSKADESLQYLYGRALFWEQQEPVPTRPPSHVKRMYSRYEPPGSSTKKLQRSSTTMSRSGHQRLPRTPSTQVSRMKRRGTPAKKDKNATNKDIANGILPIAYFEGGTQTEFSPVPSLTPLEFEQYIDRVSLPGSTIDENSVDEPMHHFTKEVTKSDIKLEEYDGLEYIGEEIDDFNLQSNEDVIVAV